jgi:class 3 adenylate cyclase
MLPKWLGLRTPSNHLVALNAQVPQTHELFVMLGESKARAFMEHTINRLAHRAAAASGLVARLDSTSLLVLFEQAERALHGACLLREELHEWCRNIDGEFKLDLDMGLSCGAVLCRPPVYEGDTILRASALATAASDGQILLDEGVVAGLPPDLVKRLQLVTSSGPEGPRRAWMYSCAQPRVSQRAEPMCMQLRSPDGVLNLTFSADRPIRIGRDERADVVLGVPGVSRQHAVITWRNGYYTLTDTSQNGTWVQYEQGANCLHLLHNVCLLDRAGQLHLGREPKPDRGPDLLFSVERADSRAAAP